MLGTKESLGITSKYQLLTAATYLYTDIISCMRFDQVAVDNSPEYYGKTDIGGKNVLDIYYFDGIGHHDSKKLTGAKFTPAIGLGYTIAEVFEVAIASRKYHEQCQNVILVGMVNGSFIVLNSLAALILAVILLISLIIISLQSFRDERSHINVLIHALKGSSLMVPDDNLCNAKPKDIVKKINIESIQFGES